MIDYSQLFYGKVDSDKIAMAKGCEKCTLALLIKSHEGLPKNSRLELEYLKAIDELKNKGIRIN